MKILYGVQTTGNGHISRSRVVVKALRAYGHEVFVLLSGRDIQQLWDIDTFKPYCIYPGLTFATYGGVIKYWKTIRQLRLIRFFQDLLSIKEVGFDVVITDFEPLSAWFAKRFSIPSIGLAHQYAFRYPVPVAGWDPFAPLVLRYFAPVDYPLGLHYYHFHHPILPPIITDLDTSQVSCGHGKILVYLPFEDPAQVVQLMKACPAYRFYFYTSMQAARDEEHIHFRPFSRRNFVNDLKSCDGVITNAGFTLTSEALYLGKKLLVKPLARQLEQASNALALERLKLGVVMHQLDARVVQEWHSLPPPKPIRYPDGASEIAAWISQAQWHTAAELATKLWGKVHTFKDHLLFP